MQEYLNPPQAGKQEKVYGEVTFREGDKVMQIKNNYQTEWEKKSKYGVTYDAGSGVFNGDTGIITEINTFMEQMTVKFDDERIVKYDLNSLKSWNLHMQLRYINRREVNIQRLLFRCIPAQGCL